MVNQDQDNRLNLTRVRVSALKTIKPLSEICITFIGEHILDYSSDPSSGVQPKYLPGALRQRILDNFSVIWCKRLIGNPEARVNAVIQLLDQEIKKLEFALVGAYALENFRDQDDKIIAALVEKTTNLRELCTTRSSCMPGGTLSSMPERLSRISSLRSLQILTILDVDIDDVCLGAFGQGLPNLVILLCDLFRVTEAGIISLRNLRKLKEFTFRCYSDFEQFIWDLEAQARLMGLCLKHIPQLTTAGSAANDLKAHLSLHLGFHYVPYELREPAMLEHLLLLAGITPDQAQMLPNVKHLMLRPICLLNDVVERDFEWLHTFQKLESLTLMQVKAIHLRPVLMGLVGEKLKRLVLDDVFGACDLWHILYRCPNLHHLTSAVKEYDFFEPANAHLRPTLCSSLREVRIICTKAGDNVVLPDKIFVELMSCPFLAKADFLKIVIPVGDLRIVAEKVKAGEICRNLSELRMTTPVDYTKKYSNEFKELMKNMSAYAPKLSNVYFRCLNSIPQSFFVFEDAINSK